MVQYLRLLPMNEYERMNDQSIHRNAFFSFSFKALTQWNSFPLLSSSSSWSRPAGPTLTLKTGVSPSPREAPDQTARARQPTRTPTRPLKSGAAGPRTTGTVEVFSSTSGGGTSAKSTSRPNQPTPHRRWRRHRRRHRRRRRRRRRRSSICFEPSAKNRLESDQSVLKPLPPKTTIDSKRNKSG